MQLETTSRFTATKRRFGDADNSKPTKGMAPLNVRQYRRSQAIKSY